MKYHEDGNVGFKGINLPYSIKERLRILDKYKVPNGIFVEIGGNDPGEFHEKLKQSNHDLKLTIDLNLQYLIREELIKFQDIFNSIGSAAILMNSKNR